MSARKTKNFLLGTQGFDGVVEIVAAGRGAVGLVKSGNNVIAKNDSYAYAYAA